MCSSICISNKKYRNIRSINYTFPSPDLFNTKVVGAAPNIFGFGTKKNNVIDVEERSHTSGRGNCNGVPNFVVTYIHKKKLQQSIKI